MTTTWIRDRKKAGNKIAVITAYDATMAALFEEAQVDVLLVGDSLGMVIQGNDNTLSVTLEEMIYHCRAVARIKPRAHVVCDLPFLSYHVSDEQAVESAGRLLKEGQAEAVKLEGGRQMAARVQKIVSASIPVMGHIGLTPQSVHRMGGFRVQGKTEEDARALLEDALALEDAGAYSIVIEGVPSEVARLISEELTIPTIGIGAGPHTDGQVLVCYDLLGMYRGRVPKFVKHFGQLGDSVVDAVSRYVSELQAGTFPTAAHGFSMQAGERLDAKSPPREET